MPSPNLDTDLLYAALLARDPAYDGHVFAAVATTGIFCRLTCPARKPKRENVAFHNSVAACLDAGFRPCKRCRPLASMGQSDELVTRLLEALETDPEKVWREVDVVALGADPSTVRRKFKRRFGMSFLEMARRRRIARGAGALAGGSRVIAAQLDSGFESDGGFREAINKLFGEAPAKLRGRTLLAADWIETPLGYLLCVAGDSSLHLLDFVDRPELRNEIERLQTSLGAMIVLGRNAVTEQVAREMEAYFDGKNTGFSVELAPPGSEFQQRVWQALGGISPGTTTSYGELAERIGRPNSVRAVGRANGANTIAILIPCHRVVGAQGDLTGYGGGLWRKRWLLEHEARCFA